MNPAFAIIVIIVCVAIWFLLQKLYRPIGRKASRAGKEFIETMNERELDIPITVSRSKEEEETTWTTKEESEQ